MQILTGFVVIQKNIKPDVLKVQTELARSVHNLDSHLTKHILLALSLLNISKA